jgi:hypothetical protein
MKNTSMMTINPRKETVDRIYAIIKKFKVLTITKLFRESNIHYYSLKPVLEILEKDKKIEIIVDRIDKDNGSFVEYTTVKLKQDGDKNNRVRGM